MLDREIVCSDRGMIRGAGAGAAVGASGEFNACLLRLKRLDEGAYDTAARGVRRMGLRACDFNHLRERSWACAPSGGANPRQRCAHLYNAPSLAPAHRAPIV